MCLEKDIQVIIEQHPINVSTMANIKEGFKTDYKDYMDRLKKKYPAIIVNSEFEVKPDDWFGDFSHLNPNGAKHFTYELNDKYHQYFDQNLEDKYYSLEIKSQRIDTIRFKIS